MGKRWIETVYLQTAVKTGDVQFSGPYAAYFTELMAAPEGRQVLHRHAGRHPEGQCKDTFVQVMN